MGVSKVKKNGFLGDNVTGLTFKILQICVPVLIFVLGVYIHQVDSNISGVKEQVKTVKEQVDKNVDSVKTQLVTYEETVKEDLKDYNTKVFTHLVNDEIHTPKTIVITKPEFLLYQEMRSQEMSNLREVQIEMARDIKDGFDKVGDLIMKHIESCSLVERKIK